MKYLLFLACASFALIVSPCAFSGDQVSGKFTAKGKTTEFRHVYAFWKPRLMDEAKIDLYVLLSDEAIAADALPVNDEGVAKMAGLVRDGKIHALELHFDAGSDKLFAGEEGAVYHGAIAPARMGQIGAFRYTPSGKDSAAKAGKVTADKEDWSCSATFQVAVPAKP